MRVRPAVRGLGELMVTAGVVILLFCVYQLFWTNVEAGRAQAKVTNRLEQEWDKPGSVDPATPVPQGGKPRTVGLGDGFALMRIPRLGSTWVVPIVQGVALPDLARGIGHYPQTAMPGQVGNFAVAGHRATNGQPFAFLDRLRPGDSIVIETKSTWLVYVVDRTFKVLPTDVWVIDPVPGKPAATPTERLITLTTCDPRWGHTRRLIVTGHLVQVQAKSKGRPAALAGVTV